MARTHARIYSSIWDDPDFQALSVHAQRLYLLLTSQGEVNNAGLILLTVRRWSRGCDTTDPDDIRKALTELDEHRFVVVDDDTEEVLIRTHVRWDGILKQPQMVKSALRQALGVKSARLRAALAAELRRLDREDASHTADQIDPGWSPDPGTGTTDTDSPIQAHRGLPAPSPNPAPTLPEPSADPAELMRGGGRGSSKSQESTTQVSGAKRATRIPDDFAVTQPMVVWARRECPDVDGQWATAQFVDYWRAEGGARARKVDWARTWQTWMRREQRDTARRGPHLRAVPPPPMRPSDPDAAFADIRARGDALAASRLIGTLWIEPSQPPSDQTPPRTWMLDRRREWIDEHGAELRAALNTRQAAG